jgi:hypothetical protein
MHTREKISKEEQNRGNYDDIHFAHRPAPKSINPTKLSSPDIPILLALQKFCDITLTIWPDIWTCWNRFPFRIGRPYWVSPYKIFLGNLSRETKVGKVREGPYIYNIR